MSACFSLQVDYFSDYGLYFCSTYFNSHAVFISDKKKMKTGSIHEFFKDIQRRYIEIPHSLSLSFSLPALLHALAFFKNNFQINIKNAPELIRQLHCLLKFDQRTQKVLRLSDKYLHMTSLSGHRNHSQG